MSEIPEYTAHEDKGGTWEQRERTDYEKGWWDAMSVVGDILLERVAPSSTLKHAWVEAFARQLKKNGAPFSRETRVDNIRLTPPSELIDPIVRNDVSAP